MFAALVAAAEHGPELRACAVRRRWLADPGRLSGGRVVVGLGPGSSLADYEAVGSRLPMRRRQPGGSR